MKSKSYWEYNDLRKN